MIQVTGTINYQNLEGGFWSITDEKSGIDYTILSPPKGLQQQGKKVKIKGKVDEESFSAFMFGTPLQVVSFEELGV